MPTASVTAAWKTTEPTQVAKIHPVRSLGTRILVMGVLVENVGRVRILLHRARTGNMLLFRRQGRDGTRVSTVSSVLGPAKAQRCQVGPCPSLPPKLSSEISDRFPLHMPWPQSIEQRGHCKPHRRSPPQEVSRDKYCECPSSTAKEAASAPVCESGNKSVHDGPTFPRLEGSRHRRPRRHA